MIRYRTRDLTHLIYDKCECGRTAVRMGRILGRSDDIADFVADCIGSLIAVPVTVALWPTVVRWYRMSDKK